MRYAFVIDQNRCIGCHACTVACKEEHNVPIGVNRTWVKYIEKGEFPAASRHFAVLRCNHCDDAPCVTICPTVALFKRKDGIVDFDSNRCIGCKSCMQACPYDALYIDPESHTAAKCNFCAHRIETNLKPACEIVCPVSAIISGDLDDPRSQVSTIVTQQEVSRRKPEKGTQPKLFYVGADKDVLQPTAFAKESTHLWADKPSGRNDSVGGRHVPGGARTAGAAHPNPGDAREVYDVAHPTPWGWKIGAYLWTKSIGAGVLLVAAMLLGTGHTNESLLLNVIAPILALAFTGITMFLLIIDLKRPERFHYLLIKPNPKSWLVLGGYILMLYGLLAGGWLLFGLAGRATPAILYALTGLFAAGAAGYSAFLFAQAKGRDLWQSPTFFWHLLLQAVTAGTSVLIVATITSGAHGDVLIVMRNVFVLSLMITLAITLGELVLKSGSEDVRRAHAMMTRGALRGRFWGLVIGAGMVAPLALLLIAASQVDPPAAVYLGASAFALLGLWAFEDTWVVAGQAVPLS